jgi:transcriptional regulator with XRE-family HTH domain
VLTQKDLGKRIHAARKAQGLTQEQLGTAIGVSAQAVSKWELGESVPDTMLLPQICKVLGVTADQLLEIEDAIGIEALGRLLAHRIESSSDASQDESLMRALRWLHFAGSKTPSLPGMHKAEGLMVTVIRNQGRIAGVRLYDAKGLACTVLSSIWENQVDAELLDAIRMVTSPVHWGIVEHLLHEGARKRDAIVDGVSGSEQDITEALEDLVDIGILVQRRNGYDFADDYRAFAVLVAILALCSIGKLQMLGISSREGVLPTEEIYF